jgi:hypothetical protein
MKWVDRRVFVILIAIARGHKTPTMIHIMIRISPAAISVLHSSRGFDRLGGALRRRSAIGSDHANRSLCDRRQGLECTHVRR